ncbi:MAG: 3-oxoacyl-[acyl-carrier-protein] reductase [Elusimicrobiaceae bacterium]|nr:3-oxoacyl-[acyl-carrier-protein] reductase [Elusimicrobiaceae bacterium]
MPSFSGQTVLITGGARGIGLALTEAFLKEGAQVAFCATSDESIAKAKEYLLKSYEAEKILAIKADVSKQEDCAALVNKTLEIFKQIDVLINNAGVTRDNLLIRMKDEDFDKVIDINLKGAFLMLKEVARPMMKTRKGAIINMSSVVGQSGNAGQINYSASKAGLIGLTKSAAKELASRNIRVNAIAPGFVKTDMTAKLPQEVQDGALKMIPLNRFAEVQDIAQAALFLADGNRAGYITGQVLAVNGGLYI